MPNGRVKRFFLNGGENPPNGVVIDYYLKDAGSDGATLTILDGANQTIAQLSSRAKDGTWMPADKGLNRFVWDMRYPGASEIPPPPGFSRPSTDGCRRRRRRRGATSHGCRQAGRITSSRSRSRETGGLPPPTRISGRSSIC